MRPVARRDPEPAHPRDGRLQRRNICAYRRTDRRRIRAPMLLSSAFRCVRSRRLDRWLAVRRGISSDGPSEREPLTAVAREGFSGLFRTGALCAGAHVRTVVRVARALTALTGSVPAVRGWGRVSQAGHGSANKQARHQHSDEDPLRLGHQDLRRMSAATPEHGIASLPRRGTLRDPGLTPERAVAQPDPCVLALSVRVGSRHCAFRRLQIVGLPYGADRRCAPWPRAAGLQRVADRCAHLQREGDQEHGDDDPERSPGGNLLGRRWGTR